MTIREVALSTPPDNYASLSRSVSASNMHFRYLFCTKGQLRISAHTAFPISFHITSEANSVFQKISATVRRKTHEESSKIVDGILIIEMVGAPNLSTERVSILSNWANNLVPPEDGCTVWQYCGEDGAITRCPELRSNLFPDGFERRIKEITQNIAYV